MTETCLEKQNCPPKIHSTLSVVGLFLYVCVQLAGVGYHRTELLMDVLFYLFTIQLIEYMMVIECQLGNNGGLLCPKEHTCPAPDLWSYTHAHTHQKLRDIPTVLHFTFQSSDSMSAFI